MYITVANSFPLMCCSIISKCLQRYQPKMADVHQTHMLYNSGLFALLFVNMMSSTKLEVHNISHCRQSRTEPRSQVTCTENLVEFGHFVFVILGMQADRQTR